MPKKILAVVLGFLAWSVVWLGYNATLRAAGLISSDETAPVQEVSALAALLLGSATASLLAGYVTAAVCKIPSQPTVMVLGVVLLAFGVVVQTQFWDLMPVWYHLTFLALLIPLCLAGAKIRLARELNP